jgi:hypothetical protein
MKQTLTIFEEIQVIIELIQVVIAQWEGSKPSTSFSKALSELIILISFFFIIIVALLLLPDPF